MSQWQFMLCSDSKCIVTDKETQIDETIGMRKTKAWCWVGL